MPKEKSPTQLAAEKAQKEAKIKAAHKAGNMIPVRRKKKSAKKGSRTEYTPPKATKKSKAAAKNRKRKALPEAAQQVLGWKDKVDEKKATMKKWAEKFAGSKKK